MRLAGQLAAEGRCAARNLRARGWRAGIATGLLAVALAANTLLFATADPLVFRAMPYPGAERIFYFSTVDPDTGRPGGGFGGAVVLDEWRRHTDLLAGAHALLYKIIFLSGSGEPELVHTADVTAGLTDMLGVRPRWGQSFLPGDDQRRDVHVVLLAESVARQRFGADAAAVRRLVLASSLRLTLTGAVLGIGGTIAAARWAESQLFGISATDPATTAIVTVAVLAAALLATLVPARQAARVDPTRLLRN